MNIQWYPGHMTKTRRQMAEYIKQVDAVCEVVDARIPQVSRNPDMDEIAAGRPRMMILNRIDLADPNKTAVWAKHFRDQGMAVIQTDSCSGNGTQAFSGAVRTLLADKIAQWNEKGLVGKSVRVMVVGIPNVGKSTFINRILGRKSAKAADRPGVTRGSQWFRVESGIDLLDTPGILWPKFDDERVGILLACTGAIKDDILDVVSTTETLGKPVGSDEENRKTTYVTLEGIEKAREDVRRLSDEAIEELDTLEEKNPFLMELLKSLIDRKK